MARDSICDKRLNNLKRQPNTIRGRMIVWYSDLQDRLGVRVGIIAALTLFVAAHLFAFIYLIRDKALNKNVSLRKLLY